MITCAWSRDGGCSYPAVRSRDPDDDLCYYHAKKEAALFLTAEEELQRKLRSRATVLASDVLSDERVEISNAIRRMAKRQKGSPTLGTGVKSGRVHNPRFPNVRALTPGKAPLPLR